MAILDVLLANGGAGALGQNGTPTGPDGDGGVGLSYSINGSPVVGRMVVEVEEHYWNTFQQLVAAVRHQWSITRIWW